jgi:hypothetical protein
MDDGGRLVKALSLPRSQPCDNSGHEVHLPASCNAVSRAAAVSWGLLRRQTPSSLSANLWNPCYCRPLIQVAEFVAHSISAVKGD